MGSIKRPRLTATSKSRGLTRGGNAISCISTTKTTGTFTCSSPLQAVLRLKKGQAWGFGGGATTTSHCVTAGVRATICHNGLGHGLAPYGIALGLGRTTMAKMVSRLSVMQMDLATSVYAANSICGSCGRSTMDFSLANYAATKICVAAYSMAGGGNSVVAVNCHAVQGPFRTIGRGVTGGPFMVFRGCGQAN